MSTKEREFCAELKALFQKYGYSVSGWSGWYVPISLGETGRIVITRRAGERHLEFL